MNQMAEGAGELAEGAKDALKNLPAFVQNLPMFKEIQSLIQMAEGFGEFLKEHGGILAQNGVHTDGVERGDPKADLSPQALGVEKPAVQTGVAGPSQ